MGGYLLEKAEKGLCRLAVCDMILRHDFTNEIEGEKSERPL